MEIKGELTSVPPDFASLLHWKVWMEGEGDGIVDQELKILEREGAH